MTIDVTPAMTGQTLRPGDPDYDSARRIWNGAIDRRPALIARCANAADIAAAVRFAGERDLLLAIRSGGHNVAGTALCDDGIVIDLSSLRGISVDPEAKTVTAQAGVLLGEVDQATQAHGLALPAGIVTHTGLAGLTLGGGIGWLMRRWGLTCDNLLSAEVITAAGDVVRASADENADLLWALRGGGGNFGVVSSFTFALHPLGPDVLAGVLLYPAAKAVEVIRRYRDVIAEAPQELNTALNLRKAPPAPYLPTEVHGQPVVAIPVLYAGPIEHGESVVAPLRKLGMPLVDLVRPTTFLAYQSMFDGSVPHGWGYYWKSHYLPPMTDAAIETMAEHAWQAPDPRCYTLVFHLGGQVRALAPGDTAFEDRTAEHAINVNAVWTPGEDADAHMEWARGFAGAMARHSTGGVYVNFLGNEGAQRVADAYGPAKLRRLREVKRRYDPGNLLRVNQNIAPAA